MGMEHHFGTTVEDRGIYLGETASTVTDLRSQTGALMAVPHIESRDLSLIESLGVDALEVYNFHSNLDPNIRTTYLQRPQVDYLFDLFNYWADPYYRQEADLALISFFEISPLIVSKWQQTWSDGYTMAAFAASDSHENVLSMNAPDGDRLDSHRRLARWVSNHWLVTTPTLDHVKEAVKAGRGWFAVEGWGTPTGFDFTASTSSPASVAGVGERLKMKNLSVVLRAELPTLHAASPGSGEVPRRKVSIKKIVGSDAVTVVEAWNEAAQVTVTEAGIYRAEVSIIPSHLKGFLYFDAAKATQEYTWIFSNPIRLAWENP